MKINKIGALVVASVLVLSGCSFNIGTPTVSPEPPVGGTPTPTAGTTTTTVAKPGMKVFSDSVYKVEMQYPDTWELDTTNPNVVMMVFSPVETNDDFRENVNIVTETLPTDQTYTTLKYAQANLETLKSQLTDFKELYSNTVALGNNSAYREMYTASYDVGGGKMVTMQWLQYYLSINGVGYVITYTALPDTFNKYVSTVEDMAGTFLVK